jgi:tellurite resistance protein TerC
MLVSHGDDEPDPRDNAMLKLFRRVVPSTDQYDGQNFLTTLNGRRVATPLFAALVVVEAMDLVFAVDSIPAIFGVTLDPFIVYTSNIFAILGCSILLPAREPPAVRPPQDGLAVILTFIGVKMLVVKWVHVRLGRSP